jgi:Carbohydrate family 9 binding domain-like
MRLEPRCCLMELNRNGYGIKPGTYTASYTTSPIATDGTARHPAWATAPKTPRFVEMGSGTPAPLDTTASVLWDEDNLYIAFFAAEPNVNATMTKRDDLLFFENDLEIFIDGGDSYYELEFNALGTLYEVFFIWRDAYKRGGIWDTPKFDVHSPRVHSFGGDYDHGSKSFWTGNHPRGTRWAFLDYDMPGLDLKVAVDGKANDPSTLDRGWTAEITIPWASLIDLANGRALPPKDGDIWGIFFGRFQQLAVRSPTGKATAGWAAHPFGVADTHIPECFTQVVFDRCHKV